uniref:Peptidase S1 domain-containing protein n=1 Tax=Biomphalaria glabrata TaxID=6526 RepID=A0A2C9KVD2_BIOGL
MFHPRDDCDIAIFKLYTDLPFNLYISAACLPNEDWYEGQIGLFVGWYNKTDISANLPKVHQFETRIRSRARCEQKYGHLFTRNTMCSSLPESGFNPCGYEYGAPLYTYREYGWTLTGIGYWIPDCTQPNRLVMYTDVFALRDWINQTINVS